jgi:hypothetical protein
MRPANAIRPNHAAARARQVRMTIEKAEAAAALRELAGRARRLPPPDHRNPHAFHEARSELAADIVRLARLLETK